MKTKEKFFQEYEALVRKYKLWIDSCSCCNGPFFCWEDDTPKEQDDRMQKHLEHIRKDL